MCSANAPVRVIDGLVDTLELKAVGFEPAAGSGGDAESGADVAAARGAAGLQNHGRLSQGQPGVLQGGNSPRRHYTAEQLQELIGQIDARIEEHPGQREAADAATADLPAPPTAAQLQAKLATLQERRARHAGNQALLAQTGRTELLAHRSRQLRAEKTGLKLRTTSRLKL